MMMLAPVLTPHGLLILRKREEAPALEPEQGARLEKAFIRGSGHGLLCLGADEVGTVLPPVLSYWREFGRRYVTALCALPGVGEVVPSRLCRFPQTANWTNGRGRSAHDRRGIPDDDRAGRSVARHGCGLRCRAGGSQVVRAGVPQVPSSGLEPGRARAFQPRREPEGRRRAVRVSCDLHDTAFGCRPRRSICRSARPCRSMPARRTASACCRC